MDTDIMWKIDMDMGDWMVMVRAWRIRNYKIRVQACAKLLNL